jgi:cytochrome P450
LLAQHADVDLGDAAALDRVISESMRLLPATPCLFLRRVAQPVELGGERLAEGAIVIVSPLITHRDPKLYPEPARFVPDRWHELAPGPYDYMPFGAGPRRCAGAGFAGQTIQLALSALLARARPALDPGTRVSRRVRGIVLGPKYGMPMRFVAPGDRVTRAPLRGDIDELVDFS